MKLIIGLGNPGRFYADNRHNIGFMCLSRFAKTHKITFNAKQGNARVGIGEVPGEKVVLAKPQTFVNLSGESVTRLLRRYGVTPDNLIVVHDDLDLPLGKIRIRKGSGSGGHRGISSIITELGNQEFTRIRIGIGRPQDETEARDEAVKDYVLGDFTAEEAPMVNDVISRVDEALLCLIAEELHTCMNRFN
jgi:PTH1 family peptidyl-tRNA hydrolase